MRALPPVLALLLLASAARAQPADPAPAEDEEGEAKAADGEGEGSGEAAAEGTEATRDPDDEEVEGLEALRKRYLALRDRLFRSRARAQAVSSALYSSRIRIELDYQSARFYSINRATIRLDGANVFDDMEGAIAAEGGPRFEGFIAPGRHSVTVRIEATAKDDERFRTATEQTFVVYAPEKKDLLVQITTGDQGNIGYAWSKKEKGSYKLDFNVKVKALKRGGEDSGHIKRSANGTARKAGRG